VPGKIGARVFPSRGLCLAEDLPFHDDHFDLAISEYGACLWADPYPWLPEAARVLRSGGQLIFLTHSIFVVERFLELGAPEEAQSRYTWVDAAWSKKWPTEEVWVLRKQ
jgi:ubiquinone/menaquinone biosynthesis C-methylase UbiE